MPNGIEVNQIWPTWMPEIIQQSPGITSPDGEPSAPGWESPLSSLLECPSSCPCSRPQPPYTLQCTRDCAPQCVWHDVISTITSLQNVYLGQAPCILCQVLCFGWWNKQKMTHILSWIFQKVKEKMVSVIIVALTMWPTRFDKHLGSTEHA